jgi:hypothetical protein
MGRRQAVLSFQRATSSASFRLGLQVAGRRDVAEEAPVWLETDIILTIATHRQHFFLEMLSNYY